MGKGAKDAAAKKCNGDAKQKLRATNGMVDTEVGEAEQAYMRHVSQELRRAKADLARENERERQRRKTKQRSRSAKVSAAQVMPERPSHRRQSRHAPVPHQRMKRLRPRRTEAKVATAPQVARNREGVLDTAEATDETGAEGWNIDPQKVKDTESQLPPGQSGTESIEAIELSVNDSGSISLGQNEAAKILSSRQNGVVSAESTELSVNERAEMSSEDEYGRNDAAKVDHTLASNLKVEEDRDAIAYTGYSQNGATGANIYGVLASTLAIRSTAEEDSEENSAEARDTRDELDCAWAEAVAMLGPGEAAALLGMDQQEACLAMEPCLVGGTFGCRT